MENAVRSDLEHAQNFLNNGDINGAVKLCGSCITFIDQHMELLVSNYRLAEKAKFILGESYKAIREKNLVETEWYKESQLSSCFGMCYGELGWIYQQLKRWNEAIDLMNRALEFSDLPRENLNTLYYNLGVCYEEAGDLTNAVVSLKKAVEFNPNDTDALFNLGMFLARLKRFSDAVNAFEKYLAIDSTDQRVRMALQQARDDLKRC